MVNSVPSVKSLGEKACLLRGEGLAAQGCKMPYLKTDDLSP